MSSKDVRGIDLCVSSQHDTYKKSYKLAILPWGATEPHNFHLPYLTDSILSHAIALESACNANKIVDGSIVLPPVNFGSQNPGQRDMPFCIHTRYATQQAILCDIVDSLSFQGINRVLIVNGHGGNNFKNMIRDLAIDRPQFVIAIIDWYNIIDPRGYFEDYGDHAGELETAVMLHYHPELVDMSTAGDGSFNQFAMECLNKHEIWLPRNWKKISNDTGIGDPRAATAEKGRRYVEAIVAKLSKIIVEFSSGDIYK